MMRAIIGCTAVLGFGLATAFGAVAQTRSASSDQWQATDKSMTDFLHEGYALVSVVAPSPHLRVFFLGKQGMLAKCSEEPRLAPPPPFAGKGGRPDFDPRGYALAAETMFECARLAKSLMK